MGIATWVPGVVVIVGMMEVRRREVVRMIEVV